MHYHLPEKNNTCVHHRLLSGLVKKGEKKENPPEDLHINLRINVCVWP